MRAGQLRNQVVIERYTTTRGSAGQALETWATLKSVWCSIETETGSERIEGGKVDATATHIIKMRYTDITVKDRLTIGSRTFNITQISNRRNESDELQIMAKENV